MVNYFSLWEAKEKKYYQMRPNVIHMANDNCYECYDATVRPANTVCEICREASVVLHLPMLVHLPDPTPPLIDEVNGRPLRSQLRNHSDEPLFNESTKRNAENAEIDLLVCIFYTFVHAVLTFNIFCSQLGPIPVEYTRIFWVCIYVVLLHSNFSHVWRLSGLKLMSFEKLCLKT